MSKSYIKVKDYNSEIDLARISITNYSQSPEALRHRARRERKKMLALK